MLWDTILANDLKECEGEKNENIILNNLNMLDFVCVAMITYIREDILKKDQVECLQRLFKYPPVESPSVLVKMALNIKELIYRKVYKIKPKKDKEKGNNKTDETEEDNSSSKFKIEDDKFFSAGKKTSEQNGRKKEEKTDMEKLGKIIEKYFHVFDENDKIEIVDILNKFKHV